MARAEQSLAQANCHFDIFDEGHKSPVSSRKSSKQAPELLQSLSVTHSQNTQSPTYSPGDPSSLIAHLEKFHIATPPEANSVKVNLNSRRYHRRPAIEAETFTPLDIVEEETSTLLDLDDSLTANSPCAAASRSLWTCASQSASRSTSILGDCATPRLTLNNADEAHSDIHPLSNEEFDYNVREQLQKHLAGQFEWLITYPASSSLVADQNSQVDDGSSDTTVVTSGSKRVVFGCNLLSHRPSSASEEQNAPDPLANIYTLVATRLEGDALPFYIQNKEQDKAREIEVQNKNMEDYEGIVQLHPPSTPLKASSNVEVIEQAVSPALTVISDRSGSSYLGGSSRAGSFSIPRIEDSLEELDKLEEELEAINAVTNARRGLDASSAQMSNRQTAQDDAKSTTLKRRSVAGQAATVRLQTAKSQPSVRRSSSLVFRESKRDRPASTLEDRRPGTVRTNPASSQSTPKATIKSSKPPTVPNFELPGEAVARRLKEAREARLAKQKQAEAQKPYVPPPRPRSNKPLTKPTFELPGEAISRRKREEREARLKAQEEEEQKKREFKARPIRQTVTPSTLPRETITSLARQGKTVQEATAERRSVTQSQKRMSMATVRAPLPKTTPTMSKRNTVSTEDLQQLRLRGKEIFERDNSSLAQDRERAKREREEATRLAREQAAERSRAASREWAEKKRRKEQALKETLQAARR